MYGSKKFNSLLLALLGSQDLVDHWWKSKNKAFDMQTPEDFWNISEENQKSVVKYILSFANGDYY